MCFDFLYTFCLKHVPSGLFVQHPLFLPDLTETCLLSAIFQEILKYQIP